MERAARVDGVPVYPYPDSELYVALSADEQKMLSGFQKIARQEIRKAGEAGYLVTIDHNPSAMEKAWPAFESRSAQKGISYRNLDTYKRMMRKAEPHRAAHLYTAWHHEIPIAAILILRDCTTAHYFLGTIDLRALGSLPSPACLLHWQAMRHAVEMGATAYNLGTRSGPVHAFKTKFRPVEREWPTPLTLILSPRVYAFWRGALAAVARVVR
jgi:lipid II:glycine glycyltransferase (peptidoglycan interpeptide bridge formation enzyme)